MKVLSDTNSAHHERLCSVFDVSYENSKIKPERFVYLMLGDFNPRHGRTPPACSQRPFRTHTGDTNTWG